MYRICSLLRCEPITVSPLALFTRQFCSGLGNDDLSPRFNHVNIQMLSKLLHSQLFPGIQQAPDSQVIEKSIEHLKEHNLWGKNKTIIPDVNFKLPTLLGANIDEHFQTIAKQQSQPYFDICEDLAYSLLPRQPEEWAFVSGWSKYEVSDLGMKVTPVDFPDEDGLVFDVEVCQNEGPFPTLAIAASTNAWYGWVSPMLVEEKSYQWLVKPTPSLFIPLETRHGEDADKTEWRKKLIVGHSVGFDRSYIKEQYYIKGPQTYFLDTLSLHMCVSGFTGHQRHSWNANQAGRTKRQPWMDAGSGNKLEHLYEFYCGQENLDKTARQVFIDGNFNDVRSQFQDLMAYCASDVAATHEIYSVIWPVYKERFPHPVSFAGMLEMGSAYLPVNESWDNYVRDADYTFEDLEKEMKGILMKLANEACNYQHGERYKSDPWLWSLDWSIQEIPIKVTKTPKRKAKLQEVEAMQSNHSIQEDTHLNTSNIIDAEDNLLDERALLRFERSDDEVIDLEKVELEAQRINKIIASIPAAEDVMYKRRKHLPGYPLWYRKICPKDRSLGASLVSAQCQIAPMLLRMTWDGFPLHFSRKHGWGYLVPGREDNLRTTCEAQDWSEDEKVERDSPDMPFPTKSFQALWKNRQKNKDPTFSTAPDEDLDVWEISQSEFWSETEEDKHGPTKKITEPNKDISPEAPNKATLPRMKSLPDHHGVGPFYDVDLPGVWFFRIPHKNGEQYRCGNPLARDYVSKLDDGTMVTAGNRSARRTLVINKMISFWRNGQKRIRSQMAVWFESNDLPTEILRSHDYTSDSLYGAIIPRVITAGTVTRRAVEPTWLTASNPREDRVGSELKSMIRAPPGYSLVGADVDSQELWIAALLGDANFAGIHGSTAFGWMTLQGSKSDGTDLHSATANTIGISRDHAKVFNYGRIYGAGPRFAERLLLQFNHRLTNDEAKTKAEALYKKTKGLAKYKLSDYGYEIADQLNLLDEVDEDGCVLPKVYWDIVRKGRRKRGTKETTKSSVCRLWSGGSESEMFNKLEAIAQSEEPRTPVLNCRISRALEPGVVGKEFITSRVNWVVQSSAVDYLHLMLVCMKWLFTEYDIDGRFCISIHDEVRFLVAVKDKYRAALALQITNLLTRAMFAYKLGIMDLPQSVAFFSSVDIDTVLRKEVTLDNKTPSNPHGLKEGQGVPIGEALNIYQILDKTNNGCLDVTEESRQSVP